jgi:ring-1,2-phenylacetyl-CoA epoxidase subunit PaaE
MITIRVTDINGEEHLFEVAEDSQESILDIAERHGVYLPFSCRSGACYSCCAEVSKGKEFLDPNKTGEQLIDIEANEFLTCIGGCYQAAFDGEEKEIVMQMMN